MAWKTFQLQEPGSDGTTTYGKTIEAQLDQIEANGYEVRFVFKEARMYYVLAKRKAH